MSSLLAFQSTAHPKAGRNLRSLNRLVLPREFQSTAHPKAGRNLPDSVMPRDNLASFNPRPTRRQAETQTLYAGPELGVFQSTAHPKAGRNTS